MTPLLQKSLFILGLLQVRSQPRPPPGHKDDFPEVTRPRKKTKIENISTTHAASSSSSSVASPAAAGPNRFPSKVEFDTSLVHDIKRSLKVLTNDLNVIVDLLDQKLGISVEQTEKIDETTLARRKEEDLKRRKLEKGFVLGNICRTNIVKDIGSAVIHSDTKVLLLRKIPDPQEGDRWDVNVVGTSRNVNYHELELVCEARSKSGVDGYIDSKEYQWMKDFERYGIWIYFRNIFSIAGFVIDIVIWTSLQLFLDTVGNKKRRRKNLSEAQKLVGERMQSMRGSSRWQILIQEDILARYVDEYLHKVATSFGIAIIIRLPVIILEETGLVYSVLGNLIITLRCLAVVTFFIRDDLTIPVQ